MIGIKNCFILLKFLFLSLFRRCDKSSKIDLVHTITYRVFSPEGGKGGGSAVQSCQEILLKTKYKNVNLKYTYFSDNKYFQDWKTRIADLWGAAYFAIINTKNESNTVYITHDYGTGFGLALLGKKFIYISHLQGPRVEEKINFNEYISIFEKNIIRFCEKYVFKKALYVCFPSNGASEYYFHSKYKSIDRKNARIGPVLYNTIYVSPQPVPIKEIIENKNILTFYSVGALTVAKGIDQLPLFFENFLTVYDKEVRWIIIGDGPLKETIQSKINEITKKFNNISVILKESCSYPEIRYISEISDIYLMFHRISIFDLATLEAMKSGKCIVLSNKGGNNDFDKDSNIIFHKGDLNQTVKNIINIDINIMKKKNLDVYNKYFSNKCFIDSYHNVIDDLLK